MEQYTLGQLVDMVHNDEEYYTMFIRRAVQGAPPPSKGVDPNYWCANIVKNIDSTLRWFASVDEQENLPYRSKKVFVHDTTEEVVRTVYVLMRHFPNEKEGKARLRKWVTRSNVHPRLIYALTALSNT